VTPACGCFVPLCGVWFCEIVQCSCLWTGDCFYFPPVAKVLRFR
jgi:hypothetical protein